MADFPVWTELKDLLTKVSSLMTNVQKLQEQMGRAMAGLEESKTEIAELKAEIRILRAELTGDAREAAMNTVVNAHGQILERVIHLEQANRTAAKELKSDED